MSRNKGFLFSIRFHAAKAKFMLFIDKRGHPKKDTQAPRDVRFFSICLGGKNKSTRRNCIFSAFFKNFYLILKPPKYSKMFQLKVPLKKNIL